MARKFIFSVLHVIFKHGYHYCELIKNNFDTLIFALPFSFKCVSNIELVNFESPQSYG